MTALPPVPAHQETFYYASQWTMWIFFRLKRADFEAGVGVDLAALGLSPVPFKGEEDSVYVALNPMFYTALFNSGSAGINETEFNAIVYPTAQRARLPHITFHEWLLGWDQQKVIGQLRLDVLCDNMAAVQGGREKYGEHKFLGKIEFEIPTENDNPYGPRATSVLFKAYQWPLPNPVCPCADGKGKPIFEFYASTDGLSSFPSNGSPTVVYAALPPEPAPGVQQRTVGSLRSMQAVFDAWTVAAGGGRFQIRYFDCGLAPPLIIDGKEVPGSPAFPLQMRNRMERLLTLADLVAFQAYRSPPCEIEPRPFYVYPGQ